MGFQKEIHFLSSQLVLFGLLRVLLESVEVLFGLFEVLLRSVEQVLTPFSLFAGLLPAVGQSGGCISGVEPDFT